MDINYELGDLKFVWDSEKAEINWKKYKLRFEDAVLVFFDNNMIMMNFTAILKTELKLLKGLTEF